VGSGGTDFIDMSAYTTANFWTRTGLDGTISSNRGTWTYESIEEFLGSKTTTFLFDVVDLTGTFTQVNMPAQLLPRDGGSVAMTVTNIGNDEALSKYIDLSFYLSLDTKLDASDVLIGQTDHRYIYLFPGDTTQAFSTATQVPDGTAAGLYHLLGFVDSGGTISEGDETNNVVDGGLIQVLPVQVDLAVAFSKMTLPSQALSGDSGNLTTVVTNLGNSPAVGLIDVEFFLSSDGTIDAGDIPLGGFFDKSIKLASGASKTFSYNAQIPDGISADDYQVLVRVDGKDNILETHEDNNVAAAAKIVHVDERFIDLAGQFQKATLPKIGIPNDVLKFKVPIQNLGNTAAVGDIDVDFYLSLDQTVSPGTDVLLKSLSDVSISIDPNGQQFITASAPIPATVLGGTFYILADIDSSNTITESNEANNTAVAPDPIEVVWRFGNFNDRKNVKLVVPDADGNMVTFSMSGQGVGNVLGGSNFTEIALTGTGSHSAVKIATKAGIFTHVTDITSTNTLASINAPRTNLLGDVTINGTVNSIRMADVADQHTITIGAPVLPNGTTSLKFNHVDDLTLVSQTPIRSLRVIDWHDTDGTQDVIQTPWIGNLKVAGDFQANIIATDANNGISLASMNVTGIAETDMALAGGVRTIRVGGWNGGSLDATFAGSFMVGTDMQNARLTLTGMGLAANQSALGTLKVVNRMVGSLIDVHQNAGTVQVGTWGAGSVLAVGVNDGGDGDFFDGDEISTGGRLGRFKATLTETNHAGTAFGIVVDDLQGVIQLDPATKYEFLDLPVIDGDLNLKVV
jgi:hypothetical protein